MGIQYSNLFTIRNDYIFNTRANQCVTCLRSITIAVSSSPWSVYIYILKNASISDTPYFTQWSPSSVAYIDTSGTSLTNVTNSQIIWSAVAIGTSNLFYTFSDSCTIEPGETITCAGYVSGGGGTTVSVSLNIVEYQ
jgi:hypothetical protein